MAIDLIPNLTSEIIILLMRAVESTMTMLLQKWQSVGPAGTSLILSH